MEWTGLMYWLSHSGSCYGHSKSCHDDSHMSISSNLHADLLEACAWQIKQQSKLVWTFIVDREVEAPARFRAIQTYRAATAIAHKQVHTRSWSSPDFHMLI